jgi:hypothetical protein
MKIIERRILKLEDWFGPADGQPVGEPLTINVRFVDKDLKVVDQMQMTVATPPNDAGWRARAWRRPSYRY